MLCPACEEEMFVLEFQQVEVDYCYGCGGVWLDSGELELVGRRAGALQEDLLSALASRQGSASGEGRRCPICRKRLLEVDADTDPPVAVDRCPQGHGLWFDRGELAGVVRAAGAPEQNVLARFFAELGSSRSEESGQSGVEE